MKIRYESERFKTLNLHVKITNIVGNAVGTIAFIPLFISVLFATEIFMTLGERSWEDNLPLLVTSLTSLGISFSLFYAAGSLKIISELIQCFLAIKENTYLTAQNTSSN